MKSIRPLNRRLKTTIILLVAALLAGVVQTQVSRGAAYTVQYDPTIAGMIAQVDRTTLYNYVANLSGVQPVTIGGTSYTIRTRNTGSGAPIQQATQYVYEYMLAQPGLDSVAYQNWQSSGYSGRNVIGTLTGSTRPSEIILLTAHLDDLPNGSTAPGADDNASGSAALLLAANLLSQHTFERTIRFALFTGEEQDLYGSWAYAAASQNAGENIVAVLNMDMLGWESDSDPTMRVHTRTPSNGAQDLEIANLFVDVVNAYTVNLSPIVTSYGMDESDHYSFWAHGYPAVCIIEDDGDQSSWGDFNPYYHTASDTLSKLNMPYFRDIAAAVIGSTSHLAFLNDGAPVATPTFTSTSIWTSTFSPQFTFTPTNTLTFTKTPTKTPTPIFTATRTPIPTKTVTPTRTRVPSRTPTPTKTTFAKTRTPTRTNTPIGTITVTATPPSSAILVVPALSPLPGNVCNSGWYKVAQGGYNNSDLYLTLNVKYSYDAYNSAKWTPTIPTTGRYKVEAFIGHHDSIPFSCPDKTVSQNTSKARYTVSYSGGKTTVIVDQVPLVDAWANLGTYYFTSGQSGYVSLTDVTGETDLSLLIAFNVARFTWIGP
jgi:hypothetical protein